MLNSEQKKAVLHLNWPLLILAWAWAWKTHTLTERVAHMIKESSVNPESILCVTFTNKAAREMKERIWRALWIEDTSNMSLYRSRWIPTIWTFHSIWVYFLRQFIDRIWYSKSFTIFDEDDKIKMIKEIMDDKWIDTKEFPARQIAYAISASKSLWEDSDYYSSNAKNYFESQVSDVYREFEKRMKASDWLDFDDILLKTYEILEIWEVLAHLQSRFSYFMVDEYQDTNELQYKIMKKLSSKTKNIAVVWDDWQWIYSWRWANIQNIFNFERDYNDCTVVKLEQNYRSTKTIIESANSVIKHNSKIMDKTLWTSNDMWDKIRLFETWDDKQEATEIASEIEKTLWDQKWNIWVLYRTNGQSRLIEEALLSRSIPYKVYGWVKFYERKEIKDILAYLRILSNPNDHISFKRIINVPSRKIWTKSVQTIFSYAENYNINLLEVLENASEMTEITPQARKSAHDFFVIYSDMLSYIKEHSVAESIGYILKRIAYEEYLREEYSTEEFESKKDNLNELMNLASRYDWISPEDALNMFLEDIALITDADREDSENESAKVSLMTIHLSKWLEFDNVFLAWSEEWVFPHSRSFTDSKQLEEERRLMYVAMTRAKKNLSIFRARERYSFWNYAANPRSRFLSEIPEENIENFTCEKKYSFSFSWNSNTKDFSFIQDNTDFKPIVRKINKNDTWAFSLWDKISHAKFWIWTIISLSWSMADIAFSGWNGIKKMNIEIAPIEKI